MALGTMTNKEIYETVGVSNKTMWMWKHDDEFKAELRKQIDSLLGVLAGKARKNLENLLDSDNEWMRFNASKDILDRMGHRANEKITIDGAVPVTFIGYDNVEE